MDKKPVAALDIIIERDGKILLGKIARQWCTDVYPVYGLPGSDISFGESIKDSVERQLKSLLGLRLKDCRIISVNENFELGNHYVTIGVVADAEGEPKNLKPDDFESLEWCQKTSLPGNLFAPARQTLHCYLNGVVHAKIFKLPHGS